MTNKDSNNFIPPKKTFTVEFWVGIFSTIGVLCFGYLSINIAKMEIYDTGKYIVMAEFDNISGLELGAGVEIAGVHVGEVSKIELKETSAVVSLKIRDEVKLREDDIAAIRTKGIIGDRYIKIIAGGSEEHIPAGSSLSDTESVVEFEEIIGKLIHRME